MKVVIAPDSFKECLDARQVGESIKDGLLSQVPDAHIDVMPMADGGEGTIDALVYATNGQLIELEAHDAYGVQRKTCYGVLGDNKTAVIEMARIAGLHLSSIKKPEEASTYGVGEIIQHVIEAGYRKLIIGLGGSATNDGGIGMLKALGGKFTDSSGATIPSSVGGLKQIEAVDLSGLHPSIKDCEMVIASDVDNKLCGAYGATYVYGPQKGIRENEMIDFDNSISHYATIVERTIQKRLQDMPGSGAAGGLGFGLLVLGAEIKSGATLVSEAMNLESYLRSADWVITGEGKSDSQSIHGKVPVHVAKLAHKYGVKALLLSGSLGEGYQQLYKYFVSCHSITNGPMSLEQSKKNARQLLYEAMQNNARLMKMIDTK